MDDSRQPSLFSAPGLRFVIRRWPFDFAAVIDTRGERGTVAGTVAFCEEVAAKWNEQAAAEVEQSR